MTILCDKKVCTKCKKEKDILLFNINNQQKSGRNPSCKECNNKQKATYYKNNKYKILKKHKQRRRELKDDSEKYITYLERQRNYNKEYRNTLEYKQRRLENERKRKEENIPYKNNFKTNFPNLFNLRQRDATKKYNKKNPEKIANYRAKRRNVELRSVPKWLTEEDLFNIKLIYLKRDFINDLTGIPHHVDHIHPLVNEYFCGLHVPWNLQILTATENLQKSNNL